MSESNGGSGNVPPQAVPNGSDGKDLGEEWNREVEQEAEKDGQADMVAPYHGHEPELLAQMREAISKAGLPTEDVDDKTLMRFLVARGMNVAKGSKLYIDDVHWRKEFMPLGKVQPSEIESEMKSNKSYLVTGKKDIPWIYMFAKNHNTNTRDLEQFRRFAVYVLERAVENLPPGEGMFGCCLDLGETGYINLDSKGMLYLFDTLQAHFPERMKRLFVIHVPYIFWGIWSVVKPLIDHRTRQKIHFVTDNELHKVLAEEIPPHMLPEEYGGQAKLVGQWEEYLESQKKPSS